MKRLIHTLSVFLVMSAAAFATTISDLTFVLDPSSQIQTFPPSYDPATCQANSGTNLPCLIFTGTLTDVNPNDTVANNSLLNVDNISLDFTTDPQDAPYFTIDNTFFIDAQEVYSGDSTWATDGSGNPSNTYSGPIFGIDINPGTPANVYQLTAELSGFGGTGDPTDSGFTQETTFTIVVVPEPATGLLIFASLAVIVASRRIRRRRPC